MVETIALFLYNPGVGDGDVHGRVVLGHSQVWKEKLIPEIPETGRSFCSELCSWKDMRVI